MGLFAFFRARPLPAPADWQARLAEAQQQIDAGGYDEALALLEPLVPTGRLPASLIPFQTVTLGMLGECRFHAGRPEQALAPTLQALELARQTRDAESIIELLGNLYEVRRYLCHTDEAGRCAEALAEEWADQGDRANRYRRQAARVRAGEPRVRVVVDLDGQRLELDEVRAGRPGAVRFLLERNRLFLGRAEALTRTGEEQANQGRFEQALALYEQAAAIDPWAPQPHYHAGLAWLYRNRPREALDQFVQADTLAPGWQLVRPALHLARLRLQGALEYDTFVAWHVLEEGPLGSEARVILAERALTRAPDLAVLHLLYARSLRSGSGARSAEAACRRGLACSPPPDVRTRLLVELAALAKDVGERKELLAEAVRLDGDLIAAATARVVLAFEP
jgi:tetratricopeptide (TPR) repeat protein